MKIVLDTNVLVSGILNPDGAPGRIVDLLRSGVLELVVDDRILAEYADVLHRDYFLRYVDPFERDDIIEYLDRNSVHSASRVVISDLPDSADAPFLEIAVTEDVPLVTGNMKHFPKSRSRGCSVLPPRLFLEQHFAR